MTSRKIILGQVFTFKTEDPERQALLSWELLDMQWNLQRVVGMSRAAEQPSLEFNDDDDDSDDPGLVPNDNSRSLISSVSSNESIYNLLNRFQVQF